MLATQSSSTRSSIGLGEPLPALFTRMSTRAEPIDRAGERGRGAVGGGDVGIDDVGRSTDGLDLLGHRLERLSPPGHEHEVGTLGREGQRDGAADSLAPARDHGDPSSQAQIHRRMLTRSSDGPPGTRLLIAFAVGDQLRRSFREPSTDEGGHGGRRRGGLRYERRDHVAYITLDRPDRGNSLSPPMHAGLRDDLGGGPRRLR